MRISDISRNPTSYAFSKDMTSDEIKTSRKILSMTQQEFADFCNVSKKTVEHWESGKVKVTGPVVILLRLVWEDMDIPELYTIPPQTTPLRLLYMYKNDLCTVIDVNDRDRKVTIKNFTKNLQFRAFGINTEPTYEDYQEFLEARCFPRTRDKMKIQLEALDIPFYDPMLIIEKTQGRMAEDHFWLDIKRNRG
ncbi:MAG: helix-turn-helix domain-containing protein [Oribacterium sp.]|nr:helix-turn-helix domain-containing protein [Oribacterium sp.]